MSAGSTGSIEEKIASVIEKGVRNLEETRRIGAIIDEIRSSLNSVSESLAELDRALRESDEGCRRALEEVRECVALLIKEREEAERTLELTKSKLKEKAAEVERLKRRVKLLKRELGRKSSPVKAESWLVVELAFDEGEGRAGAERIEVELSWMNERSLLLDEDLMPRSGRELYLCPSCQSVYLREEVETLKRLGKACLACNAKFT